MTLAHQTAESAARALAIAGFAVALAQPLARLLAHTHGRRRTLAWALLLAPLLTPALLVSYAYSHLALRLMAVPGGIAALYAVVLALKLTPVAAVIAHFVPPALSAEAAHCHALLAGPRWRRWIFRLRGAGRTPLVAGGLVFLFAFTDFELASLWSLKTWTVALFDAQVGGLALGESLRLAAFPLGIEIAVLAVMLRAPALPRAPTGGGKALGRFARPALLAYLGGAALLACGWPLLFVTAQAVTGFRAVAENFVLSRDLAVSLGFAFGAALGAWWLAAAARPADEGGSKTRNTQNFRERPRKEELPKVFFSRPFAYLSRVSRFLPPTLPDSRGRNICATLLAAPGLLGALLLSLLILPAFQFPALRPAYDTPLPLLLALTLLLLPFALPLRWLLDSSRRHPALHLARLAGSSALVWRLDTRRRWLAVFLLFCWAYFDFTAGSILAPIGLTPVFVRLHNLAHYGQTAVLSAMFLAAFAAPVAVLLLTAPAVRWYARR